MDQRSIETAAGLLIKGRQTGERLAPLPNSCRPATIAQAHAIQDATVAGLRETVAGWKAGALDGELMRGALLASRVFASPARVPAASMPLLGIEAEIAFLFDRDMPAREREYAKAEVADCVTAMAAIEILDTRFRSFDDASALERIADFISNGGFVQGTVQPKWRAFDLSNLEVTLTIGGRVVVHQVGGHPAGDPLLPAVALVNALRAGAGVHAGDVVTTGTFTGLTFAKPGQTVTAAFAGFGSAEVTFDA